MALVCAIWDSYIFWKLRYCINNIHGKTLCCSGVFYNLHQLCSPFYHWPSLLFGCQRWTWSKPKKCNPFSQWKATFSPMVSQRPTEARRSRLMLYSDFKLPFPAVMDSCFVLAWDSFSKEWMGECSGKRGKSDLLNEVTGEICKLWDVVDKEWQKGLLWWDWGILHKDQGANSQASGITGKACEGWECTGENLLQYRFYCLL